MNDPHGEYTWQIRSYECGADGMATLPTICNLLQESASLHAESLDFSKSNFDAQNLNITWVLTRMRVVMDRYPRWEERVKVVTFPRQVRKIVAYRDFEVHGEDGAIIGRATSEWMTIDLTRRRAVAIPPVVTDNINTTRVPVLGETPFIPKLKYPEAAEGETSSSYRAMKAHIDMNGHVNNVHYITWMLEDSGLCPKEAEIAFRGETMAGDEVVAKSVAAEPGVRFHRVASPEGVDHIVARTLW